MTSQSLEEPMITPTCGGASEDECVIETVITVE